MVTRTALFVPLSNENSGSSPVAQNRSGGLATRKPLLLLRLPRVLLLRLAERTFLPLLFQEPPRSTARSVIGPAPLCTARPSAMTDEPDISKNLLLQALRIAMARVADPACNRRLEFFERVPTRAPGARHAAQLAGEAVTVVVAQLAPVRP